MQKLSRIVLFLAGALLLATGCNKEPDDPPDTVRDIDGNLYKTVTIAGQTWMAENLRVTHYRNGSVIPNISSNTEWSSPIGLCIDYNFIADERLGMLYNFYAVDVYQNHYLAPEGWHIPTLDEWEKLATSLGGKNVAGSMLKDPDIWQPIYFPATNVSKMNVPPGGYRDGNGTFREKDIQAYFWTSSRDGSYEYYRVAVSIFKQSDNIGFWGTDMGNGFSVRCVKD